MPHRLRTWILALALLLGASAVHAAESPLADPANEYWFKGSYLLSLPRVVTWPTNAPAGGTNSIIFGIMAGTNTMAEFKKMFESEYVRERNFVLREVTNVVDSSSCHILFVTREANKTPAELLKAIGSAPVLLVGDTANFAEQGGMIGIKPHRGSWKLEANYDAATKAGITLDRQLAYIADLVKTKPPQ